MSLSFSAKWTNFFPPRPTYSENDVPDLTGKAYIVSGANTGMGKDVSRILYAHNAQVYLACRSEERAKAAIADIQKTVPSSKGSLTFLALDLADLSTIKPSVAAFLARETQLHGLFNNAGVMYLDTKGPQTTPQGYEMNLGINVLGTFLFTKLLTPTLISTAKTAPAGSIRIIWLSSLGLELSGEKSLGLSLGNWDEKAKKPGMERYAMSKAGNWLHGAECAQRLKKDGVVSVPINPGNLHTELARQHPKFVQWILSLIVYPVVYGALTQVYAMFSRDIGIENSGIWVAPFGRLLPLREDLLDATRAPEEGGNGHAAKFWDWTEEQVKPYV